MKISEKVVKTGCRKGMFQKPSVVFVYLAKMSSL